MGQATEDPKDASAPAPGTNPRSREAGHCSPSRICCCPLPVTTHVFGAAAGGDSRRWGRDRATRCSCRPCVEIRSCPTAPNHGPYVLWSMNGPGDAGFRHCGVTAKCIPSSGFRTELCAACVTYLYKQLTSMAELPFPIPFIILIWTQSHPAGLSEPTADGWRIGLHPLEGLPGALVPLLELVPDRARLLAVRCGGRRVILADRRRPATSMQRPVGRPGAPSADNATPIAERRGSGSVQSHFSVTGAVTRLATAGRSPPRRQPKNALHYQTRRSP